MLAAMAHAVAALIEAAGSALLVGFVLAACGVLARGGGPERARLVVAEGAVLALSFKTGATLLKTLDLPSWEQIAAFAAILALRTALKRAFAARGPRWPRPPAGRAPTIRAGAGPEARISARIRSRAPPRPRAHSEAVNLSPDLNLGDWIPFSAVPE